MSRTLRLLGFLLLLSALLWAKDFVMPRLVAASSLDWKDAHPEEQVIFGASPYDTKEKASLFHSKLLENDILPVLVVVTNDGDRPVVVSDARFQLVTRDRAKASPMSVDDMRRRLSNLKKPGDRTVDKLPYPFPGKNKVKGGLSKDEMEELETASFKARAVEPHASQQGFLFFDSGDLQDPASDAHLYLTGVRDSNGHELMFFDVAMGKK